MDIPPQPQFRKELKKIAALIDAPDSKPGKQMRAKRENASTDWDEKADTLRSEASLEEHVLTFEKAGELLATKGRP
jgi:hypothetical protein